MWATSVSTRSLYDALFSKVSKHQPQFMEMNRHESLEYDLPEELKHTTASG